MNEIMNPTQQEQYGVNLGNSRATFGLSNSPDFNNSEGYATRQALEARPTTLKVIRRIRSSSTNARSSSRSI